jgi:hypothetical protein
MSEKVPENVKLNYGTAPESPQNFPATFSETLHQVGNGCGGTERAWLS